MAQVEESVKQSVDKTLVKKSLEGSIGTITLDNPAKHNALSAPLIGDLLAALSDLASSGARVIVLRATKGREGLVCGARCPGVADQRPRSIDVRRSAAACGTRHKRITDAHNRHGRGRRVGWSLRVGHEL